MLNQVVDLIKDHIELAHLECSYEKAQSGRRLGVGALIAFCGLCSFLFIQLAAIIGLLKLGIPLYGVCLGFGALYALVGTWIYRRFGHRDSRAGEPFQGSREELLRSLQWIQQLLS